MTLRWGWTSARRFPLVPTLALSLSFVACGGGRRGPEPSATPRAVAVPPQASAIPGASTASAIPEKPTDGPPLVAKLLDPGALPRRELRYSFEPGIEHFEADVRVASLRSLDNQPQDIFEPPTFRISARVEPQNRDAEGVVYFAAVIDKWEVLDDVKLAPELRRQLESEIRVLDGLLASIWVSPRGHVEAVRIQMRKPLERMKPLVIALDDVLRRGFAPFPSEPVGVGAKWDVESPDQGTDLPLTRHDVYSLVEADEGGATVERSSNCSAGPQPLPPPREKVQLDAYAVTGTGQLHPFFTKFIGGGYTSASQRRFELSPRTGLGTRVVWSYGSIVHVRPARHDAPR